MARRGRPRTDVLICCSSRCLRQIGTEEKAVAITCFARTLGMGKQRTSKSERLFLCPQCAYRVASVEKEPAKTAPFDLAIYHVLLDLVGADDDVAVASWEQLQQRRNELLYPTALGEGQVLPPLRRLKEAS
jgi:hypothetical protein